MTITYKCAFCGELLTLSEWDSHQCPKKPSANIEQDKNGKNPEVEKWLLTGLEETAKRQAKEINKLSLLMGETMKDMAAAINYITSGLPRTAEKKLRERWNANSEVLGKVDEG